MTPSDPVKPSGQYLRSLSGDLRSVAVMLRDAEQRVIVLISEVEGDGNWIGPASSLYADRLRGLSKVMAFETRAIDEVCGELESLANISDETSRAVEAWADARTDAVVRLRSWEQQARDEVAVSALSGVPFAGPSSVTSDRIRWYQDFIEDGDHTSRQSRLAFEERVAAAGVVVTSATSRLASLTRPGFFDWTDGARHVLNFPENRNLARLARATLQGRLIQKSGEVMRAFGLERSGLAAVYRGSGIVGGASSVLARRAASSGVLMKWFPVAELALDVTELGVLHDPSASRQSEKFNEKASEVAVSTAGGALAGGLAASGVLTAAGGAAAVSVTAAASAGVAAAGAGVLIAQGLERASQGLTGKTITDHWSDWAVQDDLDRVLYSDMSYAEKDAELQEMLTVSGTLKLMFGLR